MIKVILSDGTLIQVGFHHEILPDHDRFSHSTECRLFWQASPESTPALIAESYANCSVKDRFVKAVGRKLALARALDRTTLTRADRTLIWAAYFGSH